jgi:hypothetical protein
MGPLYCAREQFKENPGDPHKAWDASATFRLNADPIHCFPFGSSTIARRTPPIFPGAVALRRPGQHRCAWIICSWIHSRPSEE